jgi:DNA-directed RNA polymerase specialized sigma24 family protein
MTNGNKKDSTRGNKKEERRINRTDQSRAPERGKKKRNKKGSNSENERNETFNSRAELDAQIETILGRVTHLVLAMLGQGFLPRHLDIDDLVQEVMVRVIRSWHRIPSGQGQQACLYRVIRNTFWTSLRFRYRHEDINQDEARVKLTPAKAAQFQSTLLALSGANPQAWKFCGMDLHLLLDGNRKEHSIAWLYSDGEEWKDIAKATGMTVDVAKKDFQKLKKQFRQDLPELRECLHHNDLGFSIMSEDRLRND